MAPAATDAPQGVDIRGAMTADALYPYCLDLGHKRQRGA